MIKTFRGNLDSGGQTRIRLSTKQGKIGYKIVNFQVMPVNPTTEGGEKVMKIFKIKQTSVTAIVDFADGNLLGSVLFTSEANPYYPTHISTVFEQEVFNQDVYVTYVCTQTKKCSYYIEIETIPLTDTAASVSTLRDIRLNPQVGG